MTTAEKLIRAKTDIDAVFEAGKSQGGDTEAAFNEGKLAAERERFEVLQKGGKATDYREMFAGASWTDETFKPIYDIKPTNAARMFPFSRITNLKELLEKQGVTLDLSNITSGQVTQMFANCRITDVGILNVSNANEVNYLFQDASYLVNVEKVILSGSGTQTFTQSFGARNLVEIRFEGVFGKSADFKLCKSLSADSLNSIITHLSDTATGQTITLPTTAESTYNAKYGDGAWATLLSTKQNWSIAYA